MIGEAGGLCVDSLEDELTAVRAALLMCVIGNSCCKRQRQTTRRHGAAAAAAEGRRQAVAKAFGAGLALFESTML